MPRQTLKKRADGRYVCKYNGKFFYGKTQGEALAARDEYKRAEADAAYYAQKPMTTLEYTAKWLSVYRCDVSPAAYRQYAVMLEAFCLFIGSDKPMEYVTKTDIAAYFNSIARKSTSYITKAKTLIRAMFADAVSDGVIKVDPASRVKTPQGTSGSHRALEPWERELVHKMVDHRFGVAAMLMLYAGLRRGEVLAFDIDRDVDFEHGRLYVREAVSFDSDIRGRIKSPKTSAGTREMPLFSPLRAVLAGRHGLAISTADGERMTLSAFSRAWESYLVQMGNLHNGFSKRWARGRDWEPMTIRTHDFRHSFCTMCCDAHVPIEVLMLWMGHADDKMIRHIYDHVTNARQVEAERAAEKLLEQKAQVVKTVVNFGDGATEALNNNDFTKNET